MAHTHCVHSLPPKARTLLLSRPVSEHRSSPENWQAHFRHHSKLQRGSQAVLQTEGPEWPPNRGRNKIELHRDRRLSRGALWLVLTHRQPPPTRRALWLVLTPHGSEP